MCCTFVYSVINLIRNKQYVFFILTPILERNWRRLISWHLHFHFYKSINIFLISSLRFHIMTFQHFLRFSYAIIETYFFSDQVLASKAKGGCWHLQKRCKIDARGLFNKALFSGNFTFVAFARVLHLPPIVEHTYQKPLLCSSHCAST